MAALAKAMFVVICTAGAAYLSGAFIAWDMGWVAATDPFIRALALAGTAWLSVLALLWAFDK